MGWLLLITWLLLPATCFGILPPLPFQEILRPSTLDGVKVPVILGVMSRCPDAILCEGVIDEVLKRVANKMDLSLTFIARINSSEPDFGVTCKHGPGECAGNVQELCAARHEPLFKWWQFVQCLNAQGFDNIGRPEVALRCAKIAHIDWNTGGTGSCAGLDGSGRGEEGVKLLRESVNVSQSLGIQKSCTVLISGKQVCVHDGTWKNCEAGHAPEDFVRQINHEYERLNNNDYTNFEYGDYSAVGTCD